MTRPMHIAFFGSSLVSAYWNGAATYYRGLIRALAERGHHVTFYEPDAFQRQQHRDLDDPEWAQVVVYSSTGTDDVYRCLEAAAQNDVIIKASGVGVFDELLEREVLRLQSDSTSIVFWDVDAPATLQRLHDTPEDPFHLLIPQYDVILTYGGGPPVTAAYAQLGAQTCAPIYNGLDPETHHPVPHDPQFSGVLAFCGNRLPDREARVQEFFFHAAELFPEGKFLLGGSGWDSDIPELPNVVTLGHIYTHQHNALNSTPRTVLNISRDSMAKTGFSPATRVFEAAGAAACLITDAWEGIDCFFEPGREILVAENGEDVAKHLHDLTPDDAMTIGLRALKRALQDHTYQRRAVAVEQLLSGSPTIGSSV